MKKQFIKKTWGRIVAIIVLAFVFIIAQSVIAAGSPVSLGGFVTGRNARVEQFQLAPAPTPSNVNAYSPSLNGQTLLRVYGDSILSDTIINENASFTGGADYPFPAPPKTFNVGYNSISEAPSLAAFQVNGGIRVSDLSDSSQSDIYCLCANGYGELMRCGVYNPSIGETCEDAL